MPTKIQLRRDSYLNFGTAQVNAGSTPILASGEPAWDSGTILKLGDGVKAYQKLPSIQPVHYCVLTSNTNFVAGTNILPLFGSSIILDQSVVYEIEYQATLYITTTGSSAAGVKFGNTFAGSAGNSRYFVEWTTGTTANYVSTTVHKEVHTNWADDVTVLAASATADSYYVSFKVKGIMINSADGSTNTLNPKITLTNGNWTTAIIGSGSYMKVTALGQKNTSFLSGNWTDVSGGGGGGGGGFPVMA
jgi:hypothetical protein